VSTYTVIAINKKKSTKIADILSLTRYLKSKNIFYPYVVSLKILKMNPIVTVNEENEVLKLNYNNK